MSRLRRSASNALAASGFGLLAMLLGSSAGCEFVSRVDRAEIPEGAGGVGNGGAGGTAGSCAIPSTCPGTDTVCRTRTCQAGTCGFSDAAAGTVTDTQTAGDCLREVCDGQGAVTTEPDDTDIFDDMKECTTDICAAGKPQNMPLAAGASCKTDGGVVCDGAGSCVECVGPSNCTSLVCTANKCVSPACVDTVKNGTETDVDCGGTDCTGCADGKACNVASDCANKICNAKVCQIATCTDKVANGTETDIDCGGSCTPCAPGLGCSLNSDCIGGSCSGSVCLATCTDNIKNANETDVDCGGPTCGPCADNKVCSVGTDCSSNICNNGACQASSCNDMVQNSGETGIDCGGPTCLPCADGGGCSKASDCTSNVCTGMVCQAPTCSDMTKNGAESDIDCGGGVCLGCDLGKTCGQNADCTSNICVNGTCVAALCGDGLVTGAETCDDGNTTANDGCSATCAPETGFTCNAAMPTVCTPICNDSLVVAGEGCDDGNGTNGDGCSATCAIELGYACTGAPSVCTSKCGDGVVLLGETCDDGNNFGGDGCSTVCTTETGFNCPGSPSVCSAICGDGKVVGFEDCDDGNTTAGDGCNGTCNVELSYGCTGTPSVCSPIELEPNNICANASGPFTPPFVLNGRILPAADLDYVKINVPAYADLRIEAFAPVVGQCTADPDLTLYAGDCTTQLIYDDLDGINFCALINPAVDTVATNLAPGSYFVKINEFGNNDSIASYQIQFTFTALCGNGIVEGTETCDDGNLTAGDGCGNNCRVEQAWQCTGTPSVCSFTCGNGVVNATEQCDDGNINPSDGCNGTCNVEAGFICAGMPSVCVLTCGNGALDGTDQCDDGNTVNGDGCSSGCTVELNHKCTGIPSVCPFVEQSCNDGTDNDSDGLIDAADTDCQIPAYFPACAAGQALQIIRSVDVPKAIPDSNTTGVTSNLYVGSGAGTIARAAMFYNIPHTWDSDLDLTLVRPNGTGLDVCSGNGGSGDNYTNTVLDSTCASQVTGGTAPFSGCYQPETPFTTFIGTSASGLWKFKAVDHAGGDVGTITSWAMIFCTTP